MSRPQARVRIRIRVQNGNDVEMEEDETFSSIPKITIILGSFGPLLEYHNFDDLDTSFCNANLINDSGLDVPQPTVQRA